MIYQHMYKLWLLSILEECGNFKEASTRAHISQSAFSQNLSALEGYLQKSLVIRERGFISLTPDGKYILSTVRPMLRELDMLESEALRPNTLKGTIRFGAYESLAIFVLPRLFSRLGGDHPQLKLDIRTSRSDELTRLVSKGSLDLALVVDPGESNKYEIEHLCEDEFGLFVSLSLAHKDASELLTRPGLATIASVNHGHSTFYTRFLSRLPKKANVSITCDSFETIRNLASSGTLVGLLPKRVANRNRGELVQIWPNKKTDGAVSRHSICLISRKSTLPEITEAIKQELRILLANENVD